MIAVGEMRIVLYDKISHWGCLGGVSGLISYHLSRSVSCQPHCVFVCCC